jgi:hypothetical protein
MFSLILERIERIAKEKHGSDVSKAAEEYFRDHPKELESYKAGVTGVNRRAGEDREYVNKLVGYRIEEIAYRNRLDLNKPADRLTVYSKIFADDPDLFKRYRAANSVHVGKVSLTD